MQESNYLRCFLKTESREVLQISNAAEVKWLFLHRGRWVMAIKAGSFANLALPRFALNSHLASYRELSGLEIAEYLIESFGNDGDPLAVDP